MPKVISYADDFVSSMDGLVKFFSSFPFGSSFETAAQPLPQLPFRQKSRHFALGGPSLLLLGGLGRSRCCLGGRPSWRDCVRSIQVTTVHFIKMMNETVSYQGS